MNNERPSWELKDVPKSVYGVLGLGKMAVISLMDRADAWLFDRYNGPEDQD